MKPLLPLFALTSCLLFNSGAQAVLAEDNSTPLDFTQALKLALENDQDLLTVQQAYQGAVSGHDLSRSALLPQLSATVFTRRTEEETSNSSNPAIIANGTVDYDTDGYNLTLSQSIYNHANYKILQQTDLAVAAATAQLDAAQDDLIIRLADAYFNVLSAEDNLKFASAEKEAIGQQLERTRKRFEVGLVAVTDVKESQALYDTSVAQEIDAQNTLAATKEALAVILGQHVEQLVPMKEDIPLTYPDPANITEWSEQAKLNNPSYLAAQYNFQSAQKQADARFAGHYPTLDLNAQRSYTDPEGGSFVTTESTDTTLTLQLSIPIYSGGATDARYRQSVALKEQARAQQEKTLRQTLQQARDAYLGVSSSIAQVNALKQALASSQIAHEATRAGFEAGTRIAIDVLSALREVYRAERDYARARYTYVINTLRLKQAAGLLTLDDAYRIDQFLQ